MHKVEQHQVMFSINQNHQESVSVYYIFYVSLYLALIKITKSPYQQEINILMAESLALIKITKSPYLEISKVAKMLSLALIKITKSPYQSDEATATFTSLALIKITKSPYLSPIFPSLALV